MEDFFSTWKKLYFFLRDQIMFTVAQGFQSNIAEVSNYARTLSRFKVGQRLRGISTAIKYSFIPILPETLFLQLDCH